MTPDARPTPAISFRPTQISQDHSKGVRNITRRVVRQLEGLGMLDLNSVPDSDDDPSPPQSSHPTPPPKVSTPPVPTSTFCRIWKDFEIPRKVLHSSIGFATVYLYVSGASVQSILVVLWSSLAIIVPADLLRFRSTAFARLYERVLGFLMRDSEKDTVNGVVWYILGVNFVLTFYPSDVATVAILILSWADTAASTVGRLYGSRSAKLPSRLPILRLPLAPRKSVAGFLAAAATGALIVAGFWSFVAPLRHSGSDPLTWTWNGGLQSSTGESLGAGGLPGLLIISGCAGLVTAVAEALDLGALDDNLTLPIIAGGTILGLFHLLSATIKCYFA